MAGTHGKRDASFPCLPFECFIQAHQDPVVFVVSLIHLQNIFHGVDKIDILPGRDAPAFSQPRLQAVFYVRRIVSVEITSTTPGSTGFHPESPRSMRRTPPKAPNKPAPPAWPRHRHREGASRGSPRPCIPEPPPTRPVHIAHGPARPSPCRRPTSRRTWAHLRRSADPLQLSTIPREASGARRLPVQRDRFSRLIQPLPAFRSTPRPGQA